MRGTGYPHVLPEMVLRFIPACAGNSARRSGWSGEPTVHPRVCGEQASTCTLPNTGSGSSPRVRGTDLDEGFASSGFRFIPACAGNRMKPTSSGSVPVHPRVCGEQDIHNTGTLTGDGSSPRVRGTGGSFDPSGKRWRFIPACAGNRAYVTRSGPSHSVHPRVCGEQFIFMTCPFYSPGSSPRVRGTDGHMATVAANNRFIPACAGNSSIRQLLSTTSSVHPRVCGEQKRPGGRRSQPRFIPACAGNRPVRS